jgi:CHAT domain
MRLADLRIGLLFYLVDAARVHALLIDSDGQVETFALGRWLDWFPAIDALQERIEKGWLTVDPPPEFRAFADDWGRGLLPPGDRLRQFDVLVIVPHYGLHGLPLHTVRLEEDGDRLGMVCGISYCSSGTLFTRCVDRNPIRQADLSGWEFALAAGETVRAPDAPGRCVGIGVDIIGAHSDDYAAVAKTFANGFATPTVFPFATRAEIKTRLKRDPKWEAVCIVSHGYYDSAVPERSGLLLSEDRMGVSIRPIPLNRGRYYDFRDLPFAPLPAEIAHPSRPAELMTVAELGVDCITDAQLVALFGCSIGAGHNVAGDDFDSMAYQWLKIGAASALGNLWQVDHGFLRRWSPVFLDNWLTRRQPKAIACRETLRAWLADNPASDPAEWGAVALFGDWL